MTTFSLFRVNGAVAIVLLFLGCGTDPDEWTEARRLSFVATCETESLKQPDTTELFSQSYCDCVQGKVEMRYGYADYVAHERSYVEQLQEDNTLRTCGILAIAKVREEEEPEPINPNPQNPRIETSVEEEFVSIEHHFKIRRPEGWGNALMEGQMIWHTAAYDGEGLDNCLVKVSDDWSFGVIGNDAFLESANQEQWLDGLSLRYGSPAINFFDVLSLGGRDALGVIYSGTADDLRLATFVLQTVRGSRLYTFNCTASADDFPNLYLLFQRIADTFEFTN